jgi:DNA-binding transcriptional regulator YhcF (GntR family)
VFGDVTFAQAPFASLGGNTFAVSAAETATATAAFEVPNLVRGGIISETSTGQDAFVSQAEVRPTQAETATAADVQSVIATMVASMLEQAGATAAQTAIGTFLAAQAESTAATAAQAAIGTFLAAQNETATGADSANRGLLVFVAIAESVTGTATQVAQISVNGTMAEAVSALSALGVVKEANVYPTGVQLVINIGGVLVWATIDDSQTPNWQNINDVQSPGWTQLPS